MPCVCDHNECWQSLQQEICQQCFFYFNNYALVTTFCVHKKLFANKVHRGRLRLKNNNTSTHYFIVVGQQMPVFAITEILRFSQTQFSFFLKSLQRRETFPTKILNMTPQILFSFFVGTCLFFPPFVESFILLFQFSSFFGVVHYCPSTVPLRWAKISL